MVKESELWVEQGGKPYYTSLRRRFCTSADSPNHTSGKSSSVLALLHILEFSSGRIFIHGIDISTVKPSILRDRLICLTRDPLLFSGTVRLNADPLARAGDASIRMALQKVGVWSTLQHKAAIA